MSWPSPAGPTRAGATTAGAGLGSVEYRVLLVLSALALALVSPSLLPGRGFYFRDVHLYWLASIEGFVQSVGGGEWPLWNPHFAFGKPILADPGEQAAYPLTWLNLVMLPASYYPLFVIIHLVLAGFGAYRLARAWALPPLAALTVGGVFLCAGPVASAMSLWHHFAGTAWLPWVLLGLERLLARPGPRRAAQLGAVAALQSLAGSADLCLMTGGLALARLVAERPWRRPHSLAWAGASVVLAAGMGAVQWLPTLASLPGSTRQVMDGAAFSHWSMHPFQLVELVFPLPIGRFALTPELRQLLFDGREPFIASLHLGTVALGVALLGLWLPFGAPGLRRGASLGLLLLLVAAMGRHTFLYSLLAALPGLGMVRYPVKFLLPASLLFAVLAGCGVASWTRVWSAEQARRARRLAAVSAVSAVVLLALAGLLWLEPAVLDAVVEPQLQRSAAAIAARGLSVSGASVLIWVGLLVARARAPACGTPLVATLVALTLGQLLGASVPLNPAGPQALLEHRPSLVQALLAEPGPVRLQVIPTSTGWADRHLVRMPQDWDAAVGRALGQLQALLPPISARWGIDGAYSGTFTGQEPIAQSVLSGRAVDPDAREAGARLLRLAGVTHVVSVELAPYPGVQQIAVLETVYDEPIRLFRLADPLPRAYAVGGVVVAPEPESYRRIVAPDFDPRSSVVLPSGTPRAPPPGFEAKLRTLWRRTASVGLEAELSSEGVVVLLDSFDAGWKATVDGQPAPVLRANLLFRGVAVASGRHRIEFRYRPGEVSVGAWTTLAAAAVSAAFALRREA